MSDLSSDRSSIDLRIVWEVIYAYTAIHRGGGIENDDYITHRTRERLVKHVIAPTLELATALAKYRYIYGDNELVTVTPICTINDEMDMTRGWKAT
jgi:hypothetical protein